MSLIVLPAFAGTQSCETRNNNTVDKLLECITIDNLVGHLQKFEEHAQQNPDPVLGPVRAAWTPGFNASRDYVRDKMIEAGYPAPFNMPLDLDLYLDMSRAWAFAILTYSMNTESINDIRGKGNFSPENVQRALEDAAAVHPVEEDGEE